MRKGFERVLGLVCMVRPVTAGGRLRLPARAILLACLLCVAAPLSSGASEEPREPSFSDPLEPLNRMVFAINELLDTVILRPAAFVYGKALPRPIRHGVRNVIRHLSLPFTFVNDVAQGEWERSGDTAQRFLLNTMIGVVGVIDVAEDYGLPHRSTDFGGTLASWGAGEGPYLVLPVAGPSNVRDAVGLIVESVADPVDVAFRRVDLDHMPLIRSGVATLDFRHRNLDALDDFKANSLDYYAFIRTLYRQRRAFEVLDDKEALPGGGEDVSDDGYVYPPPRPDFRSNSAPAASRPAQ